MIKSVEKLQSPIAIKSYDNVITVAYKLLNVPDTRRNFSSWQPSKMHFRIVVNDLAVEQLNLLTLPSLFLVNYNFYIANNIG